MSSKKRRKRSCPFASARKPAKRTRTKEFCSAWAETLAVSDKGSYFNQEMWLQEAKEESVDENAVSASRMKISVPVDSLQDSERDEGVECREESWQRLNGRTIVSGETLVEKLEEAVCCRVCHADVTLLENVNSKSGLGSTWTVDCSDEKCPSKERNTPFNTTPRGKGFEINRAAVLGFRTIARGHTAASKMLSFLGLKPINKQHWTENTKKIEEEAEKALQKELDRAAFGVKEWKFANGELECTREELPDVVVDAGVTIDASWSSRGWSATDAVIAAISADTGKVVDVVHMCSFCSECRKMAKKREDGEVSRLEYLTWFTSHEKKCYLNHEGSSAVSFH